jgi:hypothetical protein
MADTPQRRPAQNFTKPDGVALKEHFDAQMVSLRCYTDARLTGLEKASDVAAKRLDDRLATMNEFRSAMGDLSSRMVTRAELLVQLDKVDAILDDLKQSRDRLDGKASQKSVDTAMLIALGGLLLGAASLVVGLL